MKWEWSILYNKSVDAARQALALSKVSVYYNPGLPIVLTTETSPCGIDQCRHMCLKVAVKSKLITHLDS